MGSKGRKIITQVLTGANGSTTITLASTNTVYTDTFVLDDAVVAAVTYTVASLTTALVALTVEESYELPTDQHSSHSTYLTWNTLISNAPVTTISHASITVPGLAYGRVKIVGCGVNSSSTVTVQVHKQVETGYGSGYGA